MKESFKRLQDTGERMVPEYHSGSLIYAEHMVRYISTEPFIKKKTVLDIACGSGYGSFIMSKSATKVIGVDNDKTSIDYAKEKYRSSNIEYRVGDAVNIPLENESIDTVVSFETIEHVKDYQQFLREIRRVLKPDGIVLISTPNELEFSEGNEFHQHEFKREELRKLLTKQFKHVKLFYQATYKYVIIGNEKVFLGNAEKKINTLNLSSLKPEQYLYFYFICSDSPIKERLEPLGAMGEHYSERKLVDDYMATKGELDRRETRISDLEKNLKEVTSQSGQVAKELNLIKNSRSYALAQKLARAKGKLTGGR